MKEINFRGKGIDNGGWVYGYLYVKRNGECIILDKINFKNHFESSASGSVTGMEFKVEPKTVGQFTGLRDWNEVEIYEGDIVQTDIDGYIVKAVIVWHIDGFMLYIPNPPKESGIPRKALFGLPGRCDNIEVIGNIYETQIC